MRAYDERAKDISRKITQPRITSPKSASCTDHFFVELPTVALNAKLIGGPSECWNRLKYDRAMSDAYFYKGFVFECDVSSPLTIEGNPIPIESTGRKVRAVAPWSRRVIEATSVPALARRIISRSPAFRRRRKETAKHLNVLRGGREAWNRWRRDNPHICPMLACADLHSYDPPLDNYDFSYANLCQANLRGAQLRDANFHQAILAKADLSGAHLEGA